MDSPQLPLEIFRSHFHVSQASQNSQATTQAASNSLASFVTSSPDPAEAIYEACDATQAFGLDTPQGIDFALKTYATMAGILPDGVQNAYGKGKAAAIGQLRWWLIETCNFLQGGSKPAHVGHEMLLEADLGPEWDQASLRFSSKEVEEAFRDVLARVQSFKEERNGHIIALTMLGRAHAMGIVKINRGEFVGDHIATLVDAALRIDRTTTPKWRKVDFIAECVLLRSCAKSLGESMPNDVKEEKFRNWGDGFSRYLSNDAELSSSVSAQRYGEFEVMVHAAVGLSLSVN